MKPALTFVVAVVSCLLLTMGGLGAGAKSPTGWIRPHLKHSVMPARVLARVAEGLTLPAADADRPLASIVAIDIDADGDSDAVGLDWASGIVVWVNDGSGHLTRQAPRPAAPGISGTQTAVSGSYDARTTDQDDRISPVPVQTLRFTRDVDSRAPEAPTAVRAEAPARHVHPRGPPALFA